MAPRLFPFPLFDPTLFIDLAASGNGKRVGRNVLCDGRAGRYVRVLTDTYRRDQLGIGTDERAVFDYSRILINAVIVTRNHTCPDIDVLTDRRVAQISQVHRFGARTEGGLFDLYEISDLRFVGYFCPHPQMGVGTDRYLFTESTVDNNTTFENCRAGTDLRVGKPAEGMDRHIITDDGMTINLHRGINRGIGSDLNIRVDESGVRIDYRYASRHQSFTFSSAHHSINLRQFLPRIDPKNLFGRRNFKGDRKSVVEGKSV